MKKHSLNKSDIKEINAHIAFSYQLPLKERVELIDENQKIILLESKPVLLQSEGRWFPTLAFLKENADIQLKKITVDMGAVKFVASGADIMRPGITAIEDGISAGDAVLIVDQTYQKALAVGMALFSSEEIRAMEKGKVIRNVHYVGDKVWNFGKE